MTHQDQKHHQDLVISDNFVDLRWITTELSTTKYQLQILQGRSNNNNRIKQQ